jgi:hypothetical protein
MDWPYNYLLPVEDPNISPGDQTSIGSITGTLGTPASATWLNANLAIFVPFRLTSPMLVTGVWAFNGATAGGTTSIGVYSKDGIKLLSCASTTQTTINSITTMAISNVIIGPGLFYMAMSQSLSTSTYFRSALTAQFSKVVGCATMQTAHPLPSTATFGTVSGAYIPVFGITARSFVIGRLRLQTRLLQSTLGH